MKTLCLSLLLLLFISCGADPLKNKTTIATSASSVTSCLCTSDYAPVCGANKIDYENACLSKCIGLNQTSTPGHCVCDNSRTVCGVDGQNYGECDAVNSKVTIASYLPCAATSL